jgi:hypothetical protein
LKSTNLNSAPSTPKQPSKTPSNPSRQIHRRTAGGQAVVGCVIGDGDSIKSTAQEQLLNQLLKQQQVPESKADRQ